jgi:hypothetical protein
LIAEEARTHWLTHAGLTELDPFRIASPGDAIMKISRDIEYRIFRRYELLRRATEVVKILAGHTDIVTAAVRGFPLLDQVFLSASQQRKTRAGRSFEHHIAATLKAGHIRFEEQVVTGGMRPDFVLPDAKTLKLGKARAYEEALVLAAKTTLRERWKQVSREGLHCAVFLATVDDRVPGAVIKEMTNAGIVLVVPESLKQSRETFYADNTGVITFESFFRGEIKEKRPMLIT